MRSWTGTNLAIDRKTQSAKHQFCNILCGAETGGCGGGQYVLRSLSHCSRPEESPLVLQSFLPSCHVDMAASQGADNTWFAIRDAGLAGILREALSIWDLPHTWMYPDVCAEWLRKATHGRLKKVVYAPLHNPCDCQYSELAYLLIWWRFITYHVTDPTSE
jgi:hypothetical protein